MVTTSKSMHRQVQIKHDLMTRKCKYTLMAQEDTKRVVYVRKQYLYRFYLLLHVVMR